MELVDKKETNETQKIYEMSWTKEHETILVDWADKAMCYRWLHSQANNKFAKLSRWFTIPVIIISTLTGTANFAQDRVPVDYVQYFVMVVGALNIVAGIISTIQQFLKISELNESHRVSSIAWDKFYRNIKIELAKNPKERVPVGQMIKLCKEEFDRLMETSPVIQNDIIARFNQTFKNSKTFSQIKKPEICDELVSTEEFLFVADLKQASTSLFGEINKRAKEFERYKNKVRKFIEDFKKAQDREPLRPEIEEALRDSDIPIDKLDRAINDVLKGNSPRKSVMSLSPNIMSQSNRELATHIRESTQKASHDINTVINETEPTKFDDSTNS
jgi:hypothetical protein